MIRIPLLWGWMVASGTVHAVQSEPDLVSLPWLQILIGVAIALWGGATATLGRYLSASYKRRPFFWRAEAIRDSFVSVLVGAGSYLAGAWYGLSPMELGLVLLLAGYLGARLLSTAADKLLAIVATREL